ncbi:hypothetical protein SNE40_009471 [Patella caerulea]|uniref:Ig-like domain-containing protein n=1 Tax=Patella caerulea TaxID=87958 RepID=A0AAN8JSN4_PATCE
MRDVKPLFLLLLLHRVTNGQDNGKWSSTTSTEISTVVGCKVEIEWVNAGPVDEFTIYKKQEHILSFHSGVSDNLIGNERLMINQQKRRNGELITVTINDVEIGDSGIYTCKLLPSNHSKNVTLTVTDLKWKTGKEIKAVNPWTPVQLSWEYKDSSGTAMVTAVRRKPGNSDWAEILARWEKGSVVQVHDLLRSRLEVDNFMTTAAGNKRTSIVLKDVTREDLSYQYRLLLEFGKCQKYSEPIDLIPEQCEAAPECSMTVRNVLIILVVLLLLAVISLIIFSYILRRRFIDDAANTERNRYASNRDIALSSRQVTPLVPEPLLDSENGNSASTSTRNGTIGENGKDESKPYKMEW